MILACPSRLWNRGVGAAELLTSNAPRSIKVVAPQVRVVALTSDSPSREGLILMPDTPTPPDDDTLEGLTQRLGSPLAVICGYSQLWQRRTRRGDELDRDQLLRALATIELSGRKIEQLTRQVKGQKPEP